MTGWRPTRVLRTAGMALLPAVALLCCAGRADAGCGDYVRLLGANGPRGHDSPPADRPCQGPECTGGPKAPAPVPPAPPAPGPDLKGLATETTGPSGLRSAIRPTSESDGSPVRPARSIFRPPRATS